MLRKEDIYPSRLDRYVLNIAHALAIPLFVRIPLACPPDSFAMCAGYQSKQQTFLYVWNDASESIVPPGKTEYLAQQTVSPSISPAGQLTWNASHEVTTTAVLQLAKRSEPPAKLSFPIPSRTFGRFAIEESPLLELKLAAEHRPINTYFGHAFKQTRP